MKRMPINLEKQWTIVELSGNYHLDSQPHFEHAKI